MRVDVIRTFREACEGRVERVRVGRGRRVDHVEIDLPPVTLYRCVDVTFREDESRLRDRIAGENVAWLKRFGIGLIKQNKSKQGVAMRRRMAGWNEDFLAQRLGKTLR